MLKQRPLDSKTVLFYFIVPHQGCHSLRTFPGGRQLQAHLYLLYHLPWSEKIHHTFVLITCKRDLLINNKDILKSTAGINSTVYNVQCHANWEITMHLHVQVQYCTWLNEIKSELITVETKKMQPYDGQFQYISLYLTKRKTINCGSTNI